MLAYLHFFGRFLEEQSLRERCHMLQAERHIVALRILWLLLLLLLLRCAQDAPGR